MAEHLKLNQWTNLEILDLVMKASSPDDIDRALADAFVEAQGYIFDKLRNHFINNTKLESTHTEIDLCEKIILMYHYVHGSDSYAILYLLRASILMENLEPVKGTEFYGFLGNFAKNPDPQLMDSVCSYITDLRFEADILHDIGVLCNDLEQYFHDEYIPDVVARITDTMAAYYQKALAYFINNEFVDIADGFEPEENNLPKNIDSCKADNMNKNNNSNKAATILDDIEPEERQMLKNMDIYKARNMANDKDIKPDIKTLYTKALINLAAAESDDSASAVYYEKAAWMDSTTHTHSGRIVIGLKNRLNKNECLTKTHKERIGTLGEQTNSLRKLYHNAPFDSIPMSERIKSFGLAILALAAAILFVLTPLKDYIYGDNTLVPFVIMIAVCGICTIGGLILGGLIGLFGGLLLGSIAGYVVCLAAGLIPVIALIAALVFFIKALRPDSSRKKAYDKYVEENKIVDKAKKLVNDAEVVKRAFDLMEHREGLDEIKAYYDNIIKEAKSYINIVSK